MAPVGGNHLSPTATSGSPANADHQVAATNSTLTTLFGGRQHSWMTGAGPVKPKPRLTQPLASRQQSSQYQNPQDGQVQPTNPLPAKTTTQAVRSSHHLPSRPPHPSHQNPSHKLPPRPPEPLKQPQVALMQTSAKLPVAPAVLPSPAPSNEPSPAVSASYEATSPYRNHSLPPETPSYAPVIEAHFEIVADSASVDRTTRAPASAAANEQSSTEGKETGSAVRTRSSAVMTLQTPTTPNLPLFSPMMAPATPIQGQNQDPPAKRRRIEEPLQREPLQREPLQGLLQSLQAATAIENQIRTQGGEHALEALVERPRYQLLREACTQNDIFFVALHQLFCAWSTNTSLAHQFCVQGVHDPSLVDNGFGIMGTILKSNSKLRLEHLEWFVRFPAQLRVMHSDFPIYANAIIAVLDFLVRISTNWMVVNHDHKRLGYPLLMDELIATFALYSPILQTIVFRASRRTLGVIDGLIGAQMDELFRQDQRNHSQENGTFFMTTTKDFQKEPYNNNLIQKYQMLAQSIWNGMSQQVAYPSTSTSPSPAQQSLTMATPQMSPQIPQVPNGFRAAGRQASVVTNAEGQIAQTSPVNSPFPVTSAAGEDFFAPVPIPAQYQLTSKQTPGVQTNSPNNVHLSCTPPNQSPVINQGQFGSSIQQYLGASGNQLPPNSSDPQQFPQQFRLRRASQHLTQASQVHQRLSSRSPQIQNVDISLMPNGAALPSMSSQHRPAPQIQNTMNQYQQMQFGGHSSPRSHNASISHGNAQPPLRRVSTTSAGATPALSPAGAANGVFPSSPTLWNTGTNVTDLVRQSNVYPHSMANRQLQQVGGDLAAVARAPIHRTINLNEYPHDPYERKSIEMSLHQVHVRSPKRMLRDSGYPQNTERHYQFVKYLALQPVPIRPHPYLYTFRFNISDEEFGRISPNAVLQHEMLPVNIFSNGSLRVRLRCCPQKTDTVSISEDSWVTNETGWPEHFYAKLNQHSLTVRRKQHHAKDQPVELGCFIKPGANILQIHVPVRKPIRMVPFVAVEVVETLSHTAILGLANLRADAGLSAEWTRQIIAKRLGGSSSNDDNDIAMVVSDLTINLADPFSFIMFDIPVRGKNCLHLECFDLETWLNTRPTKKACTCGTKESSCKFCPKEPTFVDKWKCPLCAGDARPCSLQIDGFLTEVRAKLAAEGKLKTKQIMVSADGSWKAKVELGDDDSGTDSDSDNTPATASQSCTQPAQSKAPVEVITLDD
ncbi:uncharacterized protein BCR38DRAFT_475051 [Pseudomassariella vexata]|uniref:ZMIZ1/ZMIZ2 GBD-like domain-containing protein n=1 Tax=Pseudomassariella vexata TaxID=1141098 RepID=A0A1Y2DUR4_9PEZI|nr:uncharacterized protein BCR38DRAFT_475051 [Pseudomassariella vexata]ORY62998.1 hypothetical protein BCR38DRAFT_475051 [Pseudomassariella vexata]